MASYFLKVLNNFFHVRAKITAKAGIRYGFPLGILLVNASFHTVICIFKISGKTKDQENQINHFQHLINA